MRLTELVSAGDVKTWWATVKHHSAREFSRKMIKDVTPEMKELVFALEEIFGVDVAEVGPVLQYLDAIVQRKTERSKTQ